MTTFVLVLHTLFALGLISTVLMQSGKSAGLSGSIAGAGEQIFGKKKGLDEILNRFSMAFAVLFILTSVVMLFLETRG
ncbi:MAG: preprotein translocase subunit SecG [Symbiobacterium sp.]|jgi:protein translocase, SecG subunit|uniref:preprotein translocase subunit SecG n=1 Tax=Symbiobacterium sp. TaxID=1971213 RepID=UPI0034641160